LKYVVNKSKEETIHSDLIGKRWYQILKNELESKREDTSEPTKKENYDEETELFFKPSDILTIQELVTKSITNMTEELVVKLLR
ncbi:12576_t:CDS:2, partial [Funneliformis geosporum]